MIQKFNTINFVGVENAKRVHRKKRGFKIISFLIGALLFSLIVSILEIYR